MKKILAGVMAAATMLCASTTAFASATTKDVTKTGDVTYDVAVTAPKVTLKLVMPAKLAASLNPYGADIKLDKEGTNVLKTGIASTAYAITNKTLDYGITIDAKAITTITTSDAKKADGKDAWGVTPTALAAPADGVKNANMALMSFKDAEEMASGTWTAVTGGKEGKAANADLVSQGGVLILDSTKEKNDTAKTAAGETSFDGIVKLGAATDANTPASCVIGFIGNLAQSKADGTAKVTWNEDDAINVNLVLKVNVGPKAATP